MCGAMMAAMRCPPLAAFLALSYGTLAPAPAIAQERAEPRPNVLLILADDLGIGDLGCFNPDSKAPTPHLDALAAEGLRFTDAHSPSSVCTPTRYGLLTGRFAWRTRMKTGVLWGASRLLIEPGRETLASRLAAAGYSTAAFGKWHLGLGAYDPARPKLETDFDSASDGSPMDGGPHTVGFQRSMVIPASLDIPPYCWVVDGAVEEPMTATTEGSTRRWDGGGGFWRKGAMSPSFDFEDVHHRIVRETVAWLGEQAEQRADQPFFCYVPLAAPHTPWLPTEDFVGKSEAGWYGDYVNQVDDGIGRILAALGEHGLASNTLVIVTSDNGSHWRPQDMQEFDHAANLQWRGMKADAWEAGHRVPLLVRWPGRVPAGQASDALCGLIDVFATVCEAAGLEVPDGASPDGVSLWKLWSGARDAVREDLVCHSMSGHFVLREERWKLIDGLGSGGFTAPQNPKPEEGGPLGQLYDLAEDPGEQRNLWLEEPERVARMRARLGEIRGREE